MFAFPHVETKCLFLWKYFSFLYIKFCRKEIYFSSLRFSNQTLQQNYTFFFFFQRFICLKIFVCSVQIYQIASKLGEGRLKTNSSLINYCNICSTI